MPLYNLIKLQTYVFFLWFTKTTGEKYLPFLNVSKIQKTRFKRTGKCQLSKMQRKHWRVKTFHIRSSKGTVRAFKQLKILFGLWVMHYLCRYSVILIVHSILKFTTKTFLCNVYILNMRVVKRTSSLNPGMERH